jgi:hypothetical protein
MKSLPAPDVPGNTPWQRLDSAVRRVFSVSKKELLAKEAEVKKSSAKKKKRARKKK